jgi:YD repeat-containing protein
MSGNTASYTDGRGYTTSYTLDHANRLTLIDYPHDTDVSFVYDDAGRKTSMTDGTGTTGWTYDNANRVTQIAQPNGTVTYGYDNANRRTSMAISGTGTWSYAFDNASRLTSTTNPNSETTSFTLDNAGRTTRTDFANTTYALNSYDTANRVTEIQTKNSSATVLSDIQYSYDGVNVTSRTDSDGTVTTFGYDASDQLTGEARDNSHGTGYSISYTYDHNQNRASKTIGGVTDTYSYDSHDKLTSTSSKSYGYDSDGNCTSVTVGGSTTTLTYDDADRVTGITYPSSATNSFVYNGEDLRVSKTDSAGTSAQITDGTAPASPVLKDARAVYTPGISERAGTTSKFYHGDALGSTRGITNSSQTVTDAVLYDAFGMTVSRTGSTATPFGFVGAQARARRSPMAPLLPARFPIARLGRARR